ncbi:type I-C CRISPR-associated protein Cas7/Csd2 [Leptolinea tardivitalis]|uniref:CRISPR-associated protein n=1 Tax=Leptolinea tardivitalis TaxID=229920 RepID=A0A0P6XJ80_9CHLR|nr:type I-C CRISPR-associated protein Cas7/Csd2 [Leptolinea tardivitalis]KPL71270.1 CRISPR-associated protein [Leptolinea tardivitalis]GAP23035.1 CRISPR-associated protein, Csd2 family [Leptolinea tardivitalis]
MTTLQNKIDFAVVVFVKNANPNGDPLNGNRPRVDYNGRGELSDVCLKRKIRNRLQDSGLSIFVQSDDNRVDNYPSLRSRVEGELSKEIRNDKSKFAEAACKKWIDVRAFGQVFAYGGEGKGDGVSIGIRGPVSIQPAFSIAPVLDRISSIQITKSVSGEGDGTKKASDTMGMKHRVDHGVYVFYGTMNPQLASKTGFSNEDSEAVKKAILSLFRNDASSARPEGSMEVYRVYWWKHNSNNGQYSSAKVHRTVESRVRVKDGVSEPQSIHDYVIPDKAEIDKDLPGLECEVLEGE